MLLLSLQNVKICEIPKLTKFKFKYSRNSILLCQNSNLDGQYQDLALPLLLGMYEWPYIIEFHSQT